MNASSRSIISQGLPTLLEHEDWGEYDGDDVDTWMSASNLGTVAELQSFNELPFLVSGVSVPSLGASDENSDYDDDLISTGSLLSTVQRLKAMLHRAENTKLELCRQLAETEVYHNESMNTMSTGGSASVSSCSDNSDNTPTPFVKTETRSNTDLKSKKSGFGFFRRRDRKKKKISKSAVKVKVKATKAITGGGTTSEDDVGDDHLKRINAEQRLVISELQTSLEEKLGRVKQLNTENNKLTETNARIELQYMNKMHEMQKDFELRLKRRDERVAFLTHELNALGFVEKQDTI